MEKDKGRERVQDGGRGVLVIYFLGFYAPLAKRFSLSIQRARGREAQCYTPKLGTVLTALPIHLIKSEKLSVAFLRWRCCCLCVFCFGARTSP